MLDRSDITLSVIEKQRLRHVLLTAFDTRLIERALSWIERNLNEYASHHATIKDVAFALITGAQQEGWMCELIVCVYCEQPENEAVCTFFGAVRNRLLSHRADLQVLIAEVESRPRRATPADRLARRRQERASAALPEPAPRLHSSRPVDYDDFVVWHNLVPQVEAFRQKRAPKGVCGFSIAEPVDELQEYVRERLRLEMEWPDPQVRTVQRSVEAAEINIYSLTFNSALMDGAGIKSRIEQILGRRMADFYAGDYVDDAMLVIFNQDIPPADAALLANRFMDSVSAELAGLLDARNASFVIVWVQCGGEMIRADMLTPIPSPFELEDVEIVAWAKKRFGTLRFPQSGIDVICARLETRLAHDRSRRGKFLALKNAFRQAQDLQSQLAMKEAGLNARV